MREKSSMLHVGNFLFGGSRNIRCLKNCTLLEARINANSKDGAIYCNIATAVLFSMLVGDLDLLSTITAWKVSKYGVFSGKYGPEKTPYLDTFHAKTQNILMKIAKLGTL